jgi:hypothetical protein
MIVLGGFCTLLVHDLAAPYDKQLHAYEPAERRWTVLQVMGQAPVIALAACTVRPDRSVVVIVGGGGYAHCFDQRLRCWSHTKIMREAPRLAVTRRYSAAVAFVGPTLVLFGGTEQRSGNAQDTDTHGDLHALALGAELRSLAAAVALTDAERASSEAPIVMTAKPWVHLAPEPAPSACASDRQPGEPAARNGMTLTAIRAGSALVVIGGGIFRESGGEYFNDVWLLHTRLRVSLPGPDLDDDWSRGRAKIGRAQDSPCADSVLFELNCGARTHGYVTALSARSAYFKALLTGGFGETLRLASDVDDAGCPRAAVPAVVRVSGFSASAFCAALDYLHMGLLPLASDCLSNGYALLTELLLAADVWQCDELRAALEARIAQLLQDGDLSTADVATLAEMSGCERVACFAAELRAQEILFASSAPADCAAEHAGQKEGPAFADLVQRRLRRKGVASS